MFNNIGRTHRSNGFSLVEIILFIVIFSLGIVGIMTLFYNTLGKTGNPILRDRAVQTLQSVMEEIYGKKWDETTPNGGCNDFTTECSVAASHIGPESGENQISDYDDVDDYVNSGTSFKKSRTWSSEDFGLTKGYGIEITVSYANVDSSGNISENSLSKTNYKMIKVEIFSDKLKERFSLITVKANF